jgi:hypothetical protein
VDHFNQVPWEHDAEERTKVERDRGKHQGEEEQRVRPVRAALHSVETQHSK